MKQNHHPKLADEHFAIPQHGLLNRATHTWPEKGPTAASFTQKVRQERGTFVVGVKKLSPRRFRHQPTSPRNNLLPSRAAAQPTTTTTVASQPHATPQTHKLFPSRAAAQSKTTACVAFQPHAAPQTHKLLPLWR